MRKGGMVRTTTKCCYNNLSTILVAVMLLLSCDFFGNNNRRNLVEGKKKDYNLPHHHRGKLSPYEPGPFSSIELSKKEEQLLENGKSVMKQSLPKPGEVAGGAVCVQDVMAPKDAVWHQILDLDSYPSKVGKVSVSKNYCTNKNDDGTHTVKTRMVMNVMPGYKYESYYDHTVSLEKDSLVWTLDYDKTSDFDDVAGHWHLEDHPSKQGCTRVFYACDIKLKAAVPKPVLNFIGKAALKQATGWVKRESELAPEASIPPAFGLPSSRLQPTQ